jgi:hypothetical protein
VVAGAGAAGAGLLDGVVAAGDDDVGDDDDVGLSVPSSLEHAASDPAVASAAAQATTRVTTRAVDECIDSPLLERRG